MIYAEFSIGYTQIEEVEQVLSGKVFQRYRAQRGRPTGVLPDFFIGAHAAVAGLSLLTRDPRRYRAYFSDIQIIAPDAQKAD